MFCAARRKTRAKRAEIRSAQQKRPCQPKTAKRFFGGPGSQGPSGQAKEQTRILPVRRGFSAPGVPRRLPGLAVLALPAAVVGGLCVRCSGAFSAGVPLPCSRLSAVFCLACAACLPFGRRRLCFRLAGSLPLLCKLFAPCLPAVRFVCAHFRLFFAFSCLTFASQISFHLSLRPRRASTFFRKESRQRFAKGLRPFEPHSCALRLIFFSSALLAGLRGPSAANRRLTGKRLKSQGAELSFSSVSVRRRTPVPFGRSPPSSRCWPA